MVSLRAFFIAIVGLVSLPLGSAINPSFPYGSQKVRGVNLGGWLVLEVGKDPTHSRVCPHPPLALDHTVDF